MVDYVFPALFALFLWWFSTGAVLYLDGLPRWTFKWSMAGQSAITVGALYAIWASADLTTLTGAYLAFSGGLLAWGWIELSFYTGYVTGPRTHPCEEGCRGWRHFGHAVMTSLWHEIAMLVALAGIAGLTWGQPNQIALWTFVLLWWMHQSARLNVFLGVRNVTEEFVPEHLPFLRSFLTRRTSMNLLFPWSVTISTVVCVYLVQVAAAPGAGPFQAAGYSFLATLMGLAILEHWFLMLPLPAGKLWSWGLSSRPTGQPFEAEVVAGFLGAGKTTFLRRTLAEADPDEPTVALVNDFSDLGVDASLLDGRGARVVELPNGCICCSLREDLAEQLREVVRRYEPQRLLIEPSGVADVSNLLTVLEQPDLKPLVRALRLYTVIDAGAFLRDYAALPRHFETQARLSPVFVVNKTDQAGDGELETIYDTLHALNPDARILSARYGVIREPAGTGPGHRADAAGAPPAPPSPPAGNGHAAPAAANGHGRAPAQGNGHARDEGPALDLDTWSTRLSGPCDPQSLRAVLDAVANGAFGDVARVKGIARAGAGWVHFDVAGGRSQVAAFAPESSDEPRVVAIGRQVDGERLKAAFEACRAPVLGRC